MFNRLSAFSIATILFSVVVGILNSKLEVGPCLNSAAHIFNVKNDGEEPFNVKSNSYFIAVGSLCLLKPSLCQSENFPNDPCISLDF